MNCDTNPLEAGLDYFIKLNKVTIYPVLVSHNYVKTEWLIGSRLKYLNNCWKDWHEIWGRFQVPR